MWWLGKWQTGSCNFSGVAERKDWAPANVSARGIAIRMPPLAFLDVSRGAWLGAACPSVAGAARLRAERAEVGGAGCRNLGGAGGGGRRWINFHWPERERWVRQFRPEPRGGTAVHVFTQLDFPRRTWDASAECAFQREGGASVQRSWIK